MELEEVKSKKKSARDLYWALIKEGATKGILVTTSYFGSETLDFVKDLPISLIDVSNLVYLFLEYGYNVRIAHSLSILLWS